MKNSNELCHPLCLPFECYGIDTRRFTFSPDSYTHYFAELFLLKEGLLRVTLDQEEISLSPGEALLLCPGARHQIAVMSEEPVRVDVLRMDPDRLPGLPPYVPELKSILAEARRAKMPMVVPAMEAERLELPGLCARCVQEADDRAWGYDLSVAARLNLICLAILRFWMANGLRMEIGRSSLEPIYSLSGYIQNHLRDSLRVEELAEYCGLSYPWFAKKFREIYGLSCKDYIEQLRVARVEQYLLFTDLDLAKISEATGYADCSHMIKNFKRIMNITPGQYRLKQR